MDYLAKILIFCERTQKNTKKAFPYRRYTLCPTPSIIVEAAKEMPKTAAAEATSCCFRRFMVIVNLSAAYFTRTFVLAEAVTTSA